MGLSMGPDPFFLAVDCSIISLQVPIPYILNLRQLAEPLILVKDKTYCVAERNRFKY